MRSVVKDLAGLQRHLAERINSGWRVLAMTEMTLGGVKPYIGDADAVAETKDVALETYIIPHNDHYHLYHLTLFREGASIPDTRKITDEILAVLTSYAMDEQATVGDVGNA